MLFRESEHIPLWNANRCERDAMSEPRRIASDRIGENDKPVSDARRQRPTRSQRRALNGEG
ncbi:hypothetical protein, partial [Rubneribacter badeniensis]|uniref:hypothetical protein n=1 Tax=Rubneribacter badeniensis TaxID=2070688 RepID=UPI003A93FAD0